MTVAALCVTAVASPAQAQYSLGTATTPFTSPGQIITLSYFLGNASVADATVTATLAGSLGSPSCPNPVQVNASTTKTCTLTYQTSLSDVAANTITVNSQWSFCDTSGCNATYTDNNILTIKYQGAPVITGGTVAAPYNSPGTGIDLSSHVTGSTLFLSVASPPSHGSVAINGEVITYTPTPGYYGSDSYSYTATGPNGTSAPAIISVTVATPPAPTASSVTTTVPYNSPGQPIDLTSKITGVATSITVVSAPSHGTITISGKVATYVPVAGYIGPDSFTYAAVGPGGTSAPATVSLSALAPAAPTVAAATATVANNSTGSPIDLTAKISGVVNSVTIATAPAHGTVSINGNVVIYTPANGYSGPDSFTYTATGPGGTSAPATVSITVNPPVIVGGTLTIKVVTTGRDGSFGFVSTVPGASAFTLVTTGGGAAKALASVPAGVVSVVQTSVPAGFLAQSIQCNGISQSGTTAAVTMTNGGAITCTFTNAASTVTAKTTSDTIRNFMRGRANALASSEPDTGRRHARVLGSLADDDDDDTQPAAPRAPVSGPGGGARPLAGGTQSGAGRFAQNAVSPQQPSQQSAPLSFSGQSADGSGQIHVATSLNQIRQAARDNDAARQAALGGPTAYSPPTGVVRPALFDVWLEAHTSIYADNAGGGGRRGNVNLVYLGADYLVSKSVLVGALIQFDQARDSSSVLGSSASGTGWMAGPYVTARLAKNILFDARAAWGQSNNVVSPDGSFQDTFATSRALMSAKLSGNWHRGALRISPSLDVTYFQESQKTYTSATGSAIPNQTLALGRMSAGPEFGYRITQGDGGVFEPFVSFKALWDFKRDATVSIGGMDVGTNAIRGKVEAGASFTASSGVSIRGTASYDGIGDSTFHAIEGKVSVHVPLQ